MANGGEGYGWISGYEFNVMLRKLHVDASDEEIAMLYDLAETGNDGELSWEECWFFI